MPRGTNAGAGRGAGQAPSTEAVARRAYELFEQRGREPGHELEDWLAAEAELAGSTEAPTSSSGSPIREVAEPESDALDATSGAAANGAAGKRRNGAGGRRRSADRAP